MIKRYEGKTFELFNLKEDLSETNDLAESLPEKVREIDAQSIQWLKMTGYKNAAEKSLLCPKDEEIDELASSVL